MNTNLMRAASFDDDFNQGRIAQPFQHLECAARRLAIIVHGDHAFTALKHVLRKRDIDVHFILRQPPGEQRQLPSVKSTREGGRLLWRVGYHLDPTGFAPKELYTYNHRFDDAAGKRFRTLYWAEQPETALREVLADLRPNLAAQQRHIERYGPEAAADFAAQPVTAQWRRQHVLIAAQLELTGPLIDLTDVPTRQQIEARHVSLLLAHNLAHLDLHEITTKRRNVTQAIAAELYERGAGAVRFPSRLDGMACVALFEGRGTVGAVAQAIVLTDPAPSTLTSVTETWNLELEPALCRRW